mmetsp:Transcript_29702/g.96755  ORF Transcript_29702/g.96755 Transcript_29702/m.96755 type:complete len:266 (-) Transcript_29702:1600-2397(-)
MTMSVQAKVASVHMCLCVAGEERRDGFLAFRERLLRLGGRVRLGRLGWWGGGSSSACRAFAERRLCGHPRLCRRLFRRRLRRCRSGALGEKGGDRARERERVRLRLACRGVPPPRGLALREKGAARAAQEQRDAHVVREAWRSVQHPRVRLLAELFGVRGRPWVREIEPGTVERRLLEQSVPCGCSQRCILVLSTLKGSASHGVGFEKAAVDDCVVDSASFVAVARVVVLRPRREAVLRLGPKLHERVHHVLRREELLELFHRPW